MRITGGVLLLLAGIWSVVGGGCTTFAGGVAGWGVEIARKLTQAGEGAGAGVDEDEMQRIKQATAEADEVGFGMKAAGLVILAGGVMCVVAGVLFLLNRGRVFGMLAAGVGLVAEGLFFSLAFFNWPGVVKMGVLAIGLLSAGWVGRAGEVGSRK